MDFLLTSCHLYTLVGSNLFIIASNDLSHVVYSEWAKDFYTGDSDNENETDILLVSLLQIVLLIW